MRFGEPVLADDSIQRGVELIELAAAAGVENEEFPAGFENSVHLLERC